MFHSFLYVYLRVSYMWNMQANMCFIEYHLQIKYNAISPPVIKHGHDSMENPPFILGWCSQ